MSSEDPPRRRRSDDAKSLLSVPPDVPPPPIKVISDDVAKSLRRTLRVLIVATLVLYIIMISFMIWTWSTGHTSKNALCAIRLNAQVQLDQGKEFLKDHPNGLPGLASPDDLQNNIDNYSATVTALSNLNC